MPWLFLLLSIFSVGCKAQVTPWPPQIGKPYPNLSILTHTGEEKSLHDYKGKVILIEPIGMNCPACQAFSGGKGLGGITPTGGLPDYSSLLKEYGHVSLDDQRIVLIQLLLYDLQMGPPKVKDAEIWAKHYGLLDASNRVVAVPKTDLRGDVAYKLIPGFQLIDKNLILQFDATGHAPRHSLYRDLLPAIRRFL
jgi:hypothetical protein